MQVEKKGKAGAKKVIANVLKIGILLLLMYLVLHKHYREIWENIKAAGPLMIVYILALGFGYLLLDTGACKMILSSRLPDITFRQALEITYLGLFCQVTTFSAGIMPAQSLYLYRLGLDVGDSVGLLMCKYSVHKASILSFAGLLLIFAAPGLFSQEKQFLTFAAIGWGVGILILAGLIVLCTWDKLRELAIKLIGKLPDKGKWQERKEKLISNIGLLYGGVRALAAQPKRLAAAYLFDLGKLVLFYSVPYAALHAIGADSVTYVTAFSLAGLTHVIATALPNLAGMGPLEAAFILLFSLYVAAPEASSALVLFRLSTYFFPFFVSCIVVYFVYKRLMPKGKQADNPV